MPLSRAVLSFTPPSTFGLMRSPPIPMPNVSGMAMARRQQKVNLAKSRVHRSRRNNRKDSGRVRSGKGFDIIRHSQMM